MSEFHVLPGLRKKGFGKEAVGKLFSEYSGLWQLQVFARNTGALAFWKRCIDKYAAKHIEPELKQRKDAKVGAPI